MVKYKKKPEMEMTFQKSDYRDRPIEDLYELHREPEERAIIEERPEPEERIVKEFVQARQAMPRMEDSRVQPLNLMGEEVVGSLFDRVAFLKKRIDELQESLQIRETLHQDMIKEIDVDIHEKDALAQRVADINEKRNLKLDVSILRKEKRLEHVQYWRDILEIRIELRELLERHQTEMKIVAIFKQIQPGVEE